MTDSLSTRNSSLSSFITKTQVTENLKDQVMVTAHSAPRKRKWWMEDEPQNAAMELRLESHPLPPEWQRCLDIQSGDMHFYNTKTHKRTKLDPRLTQSEAPSNVSLDLELNLPCGGSLNSQNKYTSEPNHDNTNNKKQHGSNLLINLERNNNSNYSKKKSTRGRHTASWLGVDDEKEEEMVTAVCMQCHMLVLLCKSSPACPNCKFMHPPPQSQYHPRIFNNQRFTLFC